jgi:hypothetical protein
MLGQCDGKLKKMAFIRRIGTDGYRIGPKPKLNKVMADRRASLDDQRDVRPACLKLVKEVFEQGASLPIVPFPEDATSIQDTPRLVLVLADPAAEWDRNGKIRQQIVEWTLRRGSSARLYPASLIWCFRKTGRDLADRVETWLAWQRVQRDLAEGVLGHDIETEDFNFRVAFFVDFFSTARRCCCLRDVQRRANSFNCDRFGFYRH